MKWKLDFLKQQRILLITVSELFSLEEQKMMFENIVSFTGWNPQIPILFDNRELDMQDVYGDTIRESVAVLSQFIAKYPGLKIAGLVKDNINFGLGRQFENYSQAKREIAFRLFKDEDQAFDWLKT